MTTEFILTASVTAGACYHESEAMLASASIIMAQVGVRVAHWLPAR